MTKFLLGVAIGYVLSDMIDELLGKTTNGDKSPISPTTPEENPST